jgi:ketosteroid isomerase-like protein
MSEQENLKLVQQFYAAFTTGNINGVLSTLADDVGWFVPGPKDIVPFVGQRQGRGQVAQAIAQFAEMQDGEQFEIKEFVAQGDKVIAFGHYRWRIESTGHSYESDFVHAFTISQGKVSRFQEYLDTQAWAAAYRTDQSLAGAKKQ